MSTTKTTLRAALAIACCEDEIEVIDERLASFRAECGGDESILSSREAVVALRDRRAEVVAKLATLRGNI